MGTAQEPPCLGTPTRWNSTHAMVQGCLKLRETIDMIAHGDPFCDELILTANDWSAVDRVELFLRKPARLSTRIGSSSVGSISLAHNATKSMVDHGNTYMSDASSVIAWAAEGMLATLVSKSQLFNSNPAVVARFLDIRCARDVLSEEYRCDELMVLQLLSSHRYQTPSEATTVSFVQPDVECGSVWSDDDDFFGGRPTAPDVAPDSETKRCALVPKPTNSSTLWHGGFRIVWSIHGSRCLLWTTCPSQRLLRQVKGRIPLQRLCSVDEIV